MGKLALEDKCHKNFALAPATRTIHSPPPQTTCSLVAPEATAKRWLCLWQQQAESVGPLSPGPAPRQVILCHLNALRGSWGPPSWRPRARVTRLMLQTLGGPCPPCTSPAGAASTVLAVGMPIPALSPRSSPVPAPGAGTSPFPHLVQAGHSWPFTGHGRMAGATSCMPPGHPTQSGHPRFPGRQRCGWRLQPPEQWT